LDAQAINFLLAETQPSSGLKLDLRLRHPAPNRYFVSVASKVSSWSTLSIKAKADHETLKRDTYVFGVDLASEKIFARKLGHVELAGANAPVFNV